ncbi:MAG: enoyl-CoA hydratase-related protein [Acidimicrobiia bacterium]
MAYSSILYDVAGRVATVTLHRPDAMNAATFEMDDEMQDAVRRADADPDIGCIVVTGSGKAFCAGDDISRAWGDPRMEQTLAELAGPNPPMTPYIELVLGIDTPLVAAVNGVAVGSGMDIALACDIVVASDKARFGQLYTKVGLMPDVLGLWLLPQLVGRSRASEILMTGEIIDATEAERIGLVSRVVAADDLLRVANDIAGRIAANPPQSIRHVKQGMRLAAGREQAELTEVATFVSHGLSHLFTTEDHKEAASAFAEKREPQFKGR